MKTIYVGEYFLHSDNYFEFKQVHYDRTHIITRLDTRRLEDIESKVVRKIVRTVYKGNNDNCSYNLCYKESK
jgi:hypothetical protein